MSSTFDKKGLAALAGAAVVTSLSATAANAQDNPFALKDLSAGYVQVAEQKEMTCGEGKCGGAMKKDHAAAGQSQPSSGNMKGMEGKCAGNMQGNTTGGNPAPASGATPAPAEPMKH